MARENEQLVSDVRGRTRSAFVSNITGWLEDVLDRNQIVHEIDRLRARSFVERGKALTDTPPDTDHAALLTIQELMDGVEWSPTTLDRIAAAVRQAGYRIRDLDDRDPDDD